MSRDIKFRVWSKTINKMWYPKFALFESGCVYSKKENYELLDEAMNGMSSLNEDNVIMQYTGLKDKNGKEIYEGDILLCESRKPYLLVEWDQEELTYRAKEKLNTAYGYKLSSFNIFGYFEVVGNIYENPELLEVE